MQYTAIIKDNGLFIPNVFVGLSLPNNQPTIEVNLELPVDIQPYQTKTELTQNSKQADILSFAGSWQDLDEDILSPEYIEQRRLKSLKEHDV